ncbi:hypothetical protein [Streptococcus ruminantium]|uniref:Uncharacterized protein n=1 Tax=Streptococcus ruminantium TaxID=1917441 RepID=A0ABU1B563_9STRE|nr:hypothetical protein [Streptococcus ruminantium]MDQ8759888.1 hypothetical protein [Streptococcus ruminantium]MDQ8768970.1 hypothetical protein [Streptococcus ruminantium]MDQ8774301.1 hypothetical protein [Streptococcus ruminantium]MDQ8793211.1 hypothetical protein [Streptococcus ruminantium]MDQ8796540.1 hypothetical protein [Streptococcus ruminantium]
MKITLEQIISIVSSIGVSAIAGTVFTFLQFNKKNQLDYVTRERSDWRKDLKQIIIDIQTTASRSEALSKLKSQINPYGKNMDIKNTKPYFMAEGHVWDLLEKEHVDIEKLTFYIELLLKYDWERSKKEIYSKPYEFIHGAIRFILFILSFYCIYLARKNIANLNQDLLSINIGVSLLVVFLLVMQKMATVVAISNPSKKRSEQIWIFIIFYVLPYGYIMNSLVDNLGIREAETIKIIAVVGMFIYEFYYLSLFDSCEDRYVKEVERYLSTKSKQYQKGVQLTNQIRGIEEKLYQYEYNISTINAMNKRLKKIKKRLTKKKRPQDYWLHPILFFKYRKNRSRIIREVKKWKKETKK